MTAESLAAGPGGVVSPCRSICVMDDAVGLCVGCFRTLDEIAAWSRYDDARRRAVIAELPERERCARARSPLARSAGT
ncbi:MAG: DUF1289 domain-containing protein [Burkholderiales bacterium]